jgi:4,5-dihydroxyphthalate decarboxylase
MSASRISVVLQPHDFLEPLRSGDVVPEEIGLEIKIGDLRAAMLDDGITASELSFARHVRRIAEGDHTWVAMPAFVRRGFSHRAWYVRRGSAIKTFRDLAGKRVGTNEWPATGNTWTRAAAREQGLDLRSVRWVVGSIDGGTRASGDRLPDNVSYAESDEGLVDLLVDGRLDALACPDPPRGFYDQNSAVVRLLVDYRGAERAYYERTGVYPAYHIVGFRKNLFDENPTALLRVYDALERSKKFWESLRLAECDTSPWLQADLEETRNLMGADWQPYGVEPNARMIAYFCDEMLAQGLITRLVAPADLFAEFEELASTHGAAPVR